MPWVLGRWGPSALEAGVGWQVLEQEGGRTMVGVSGGSKSCV